jgi:hypothetical protein
MDCNFRARLRKNKTKRSDDDPEMEPGWSVMIEETRYQERTAKYDGSQVCTISWSPLCR